MSDGRCHSCKFWNQGDVEDTVCSLLLSPGTHVADWGACSMPERPSGRTVVMDDIVIVSPTVLDPSRSLVASDTPFLTHRTFGCVAHAARDNPLKKAEGSD